MAQTRYIVMEDQDQERCIKAWKIVAKEVIAAYDCSRDMVAGFREVVIADFLGRKTSSKNFTGVKTLVRDLLDRRLVLVLIREDNAQVIRYLYDSYESQIVNLCKRYKLRTDEAEDVFFEAIYNFAERIETDPTFVLTTSIRNYLRTLASNRAKNIIKKKKTHDKVIGNLRKDLASSIEPAEVNMLTPTQQSIAFAMSMLSESCRKVLTLYYYKNYDMTSVAREMGFKTARVAITKQQKCFARLKKNPTILDKIKKLLYS